MIINTFKTIEPSALLFDTTFFFLPGPLGMVLLPFSTVQQTVWNSRLELSVRVAEIPRDN